MKWTAPEALKDNVSSQQTSLLCSNGFLLLIYLRNSPLSQMCGVLASCYGKCTLMGVSLTLEWCVCVCVCVCPLRLKHSSFSPSPPSSFFSSSSTIQSVSEVAQMLEMGCRMESPDGCPDSVYAIMTECWEASPTKRPNFTDIMKSLNSITV